MRGEGTAEDPTIPSLIKIDILVAEKRGFFIALLEIHHL